MSVFAAIDCGTNSARLLVEDAATGNVLHRNLIFTRLGENVDTTGRLSDDAIARTCAAFAQFADEMRELCVMNARAVATSAVRDAANRDEFLKAVTASLGYNVEVIPGEEEARLMFRGATAALLGDAGVNLVVDVGGGSTELAFGVGQQLIMAESHQLGAVRLTERFLKHDPPSIEEIAVMDAHVREVLTGSPVLAEAREHHARIVGVSGTPTSLAGIVAGLDTYQPDITHGMVLEAATLQQFDRSLSQRCVADRISAPFLPEQRADVVLGGLAVLRAVLALQHADSLTVSEHDILSGIIQQLRER